MPRCKREAFASGQPRLRMATVPQCPGPRLLTEVQLYRRLEDLFGIEEARRLLAPPTEPVVLTNPYDELAKFALATNEGLKR